MANWFKALGKTRNRFKETLGGIFSRDKDLDEATLQTLQVFVEGRDSTGLHVG